MASKALLVLGVFLAAAVLVSSEMMNRQLEETHGKGNGAGVADEKYGGGYSGGGPYGGYPGGGGYHGGYPGGGHVGYPGGGHGGRGRCYHGCCSHGYNGCRCCLHDNDIPDPEFLPEINN